MSRYEQIKKTNRKDTIQDVYGNELGNFFLRISIQDYNAKIEICGDVSCGVPSIFDVLYSISKKSGFDDKEKLIEILNAVWEEKEKNGNKFGDN